GAVFLIFAGIALFLSAVGVYGVTSQEVKHRTSEIGIRVALGAQPRDVVRMVINETLVTGSMATVLGIAGALGLGRTIRGLLYGAAATDGRAFAGASLLLFCSALIASYLPARRAAQLPPTVALKCE